MASDLAPFRVEAGEVPAWVEIRAHTTGLWVRCRRCAHSTALYHAYMQQHPGALEAAVNTHRDCR